MFCGQLHSDWELLRANDLDGKGECGSLFVSECNIRFFEAPLLFFYPIRAGVLPSYSDGNFIHICGVFRKFFFVLFETFKTEFNCFFDVFLRFFKRFPLGNASLNRRALRDDISVFAFNKENFIFHFSALNTNIVKTDDFVKDANVRCECESVRKCRTSPFSVSAEK